MTSVVGLSMSLMVMGLVGRGVVVSSSDVSQMYFLGFVKPCLTIVCASLISLVTSLYLILKSLLCSNSCDYVFSICMMQSSLQRISYAKDVTTVSAIRSILNFSTGSVIVDALVSVGVVVDVAVDPLVLSVRSSWCFLNHVLRYCWCSVLLIYVSFFGLQIP